MTGREHYFNHIINKLNAQKTDEVEILTLKTPPYNKYTGENSTGAKRNELLSRAIGDYVVYVDDDDDITNDYVDKIVINCTGVDAIGIRGWYTCDGHSYREFDTSIYYVNKDTPSMYIRHVNHICPIRRDIAQQMKFPEITFGEDSSYSEQLRTSGLLKTENKVDELIYHYKYRSRK